MAGYKNFSMSNNAVLAYKNGKFPLSKINKEVFQWAKNEYLENCDADLTSFTKKEAEGKLENKTLKDFKDYLKRCEPSEYHHSSKYYNIVYFYDVTYLMEDFVAGY